MSCPNGNRASVPIPKVLKASEGLSIELKEAALRGTELYIGFGPNANGP